MVRPRQETVIAVLLTVLALPLVAVAQYHPSEHPPLTPEGPFPRCTPQGLEVAGFPDHMHSWNWSTWETRVDDAGRPYGPDTHCQGKIMREGDFPELSVAPGRLILGTTLLEHNPGYTACDMMPFVEIVDLARRELGALLEINVPDTLRLVNTDRTDDYRDRTGQGTWRLYRRDGDEFILQPIPVLRGRTLDGHAAYQLVTEWLLIHGVGAELPHWFTQGLLEYMSEDGVHLVNYMAEFRVAGPILMTVGETEALLAAGVLPDKNQDREMFRRSSYTAFLMVWELVENQGGLAPVREFLRAVRDGADPDQASQDVWGYDFAGLAQIVDPGQLGEPIGSVVDARRPHVEP